MKGENKMEHRVKVTVLDKKYFPSYRRCIALDQTAESVRATMWEMNLFFTGTVSGMIIGIWAQGRW